MKVDELKSSEADKFVLRFDAPGLRESLKRRAAANRRSLNAELLSLIERGMSAEIPDGRVGACP